MTFFPWKKALSTKAIQVSLFVIFAFGLVAVLAPWLAPRDPYQFGIGQSSLPPMWVQEAHIHGTTEHPLGTDRFGRDVLSRLLFGLRTAIFLAMTAVPLAALIGATVGLIAGYAAGSRLDAAFMFLADVLQSLPGIMFMVITVLIFRNLLSPSWFHGLLILVIGFAAVSWVSLARLIRANVMQIKSGLFVEAAVSIGAPPRRIITHHLLPNVLHVILVWIINNVPAVILLEAVLGYIGVGVISAVEGDEFTVVSWGGMFFAGRSTLSSNPLMLIIPSLCILLISMSFILLADALNGIIRRGEE